MNEQHLPLDAYIVAWHPDDPTLSPIRVGPFPEEAVTKGYAATSGCAWAYRQAGTENEKRLWLANEFIWIVAKGIAPFDLALREFSKVEGFAGLGWDTEHGGLITSHCR
jgi:hypothetical protein